VQEEEVQEEEVQEEEEEEEEEEVVVLAFELDSTTTLQMLRTSAPTSALVYSAPVSIAPPPPPLASPPPPITILNISDIPWLCSSRSTEYSLVHAVLSIDARNCSSTGAEDANAARGGFGPLRELQMVRVGLTASGLALIFSALARRRIAQAQTCVQGQQANHGDHGGLKVLNLSGNPLGLRHDGRHGDQHELVQWKGQRLRPCTQGVRWLSRWIVPELCTRAAHSGRRHAHAQMQVMALEELHLSECAIGAHIVAASSARSSIEDEAGSRVRAWDLAIHELTFAIMRCGGGGVGSGALSRGTAGCLFELDLRRNPFTSTQNTLLLQAVEGCPSMARFGGTFNGQHRFVETIQELGLSHANDVTVEKNTSANQGRRREHRQHRQPQQRRQPQQQRLAGSGAIKSRKSPSWCNLSPSLYSTNAGPASPSSAVKPPVAIAQGTATTRQLVYP
jgi:hypothetical protein